MATYKPLNQNKMEKQISAVEWLVNTLELDTRFNGIMTNVIEQAKAMEKEQIKDAYYNGKYNNVSRDTAEQYYTETYEQDKQG
jgi:hypothetical protein